MLDLALSPMPESYTRALELAENGDDIKAVKMLIDVVKNQRDYHPAYDALGDIYFKKSQGFPAIENYAQAVAYDPDNVRYMQKLINVVGGLTFKKVNPNLKGVLTACLQSDDVQFTHAGRAWLSILKLDPIFGQLFKSVKIKQYSSFKREMNKLDAHDVLLDVFFLSGLGRFIVPDSDFELWIYYLRRYLLEDVVEGKSLFSEPEEMEFLCCALSRYCFLTDYILPISEEEEKHLSFLAEKISQVDDISLVHLACFGCYKPLYSLNNAQGIASQLKGGEHVSQIPKFQIESFFEQRELKKDIVKFTEIADRTSLAVQDQYEVFPYPRWQVASKDLFHQEFEGHLKNKSAKILVAGCGTGQEAIQLSYVFPDAEITAVDLSQTSLAYAIAQAKRLGLDNIRFGQADIMSLSQLDQKFDYIASAGVLHHMADPIAGWRVLNGLLKENGLMRIALYSRKARWAINAARDIISENKIGSDEQSIKSFRAEIFDTVKYKYLKNILGFYDYYSLSECRDLLFHVCEHQYDLLEIKDILHDLNHEFLGFYLDAKTLAKYKRQNKHDDNATDLESWSKWEGKNPDTFASMYTFWSRKT